MEMKMEQVLPEEIEKRSFEIIIEELRQKGIVLPEKHKHIYEPTRLLSNS